VARADPAVVRRVRAEDEAAERERLERDRELEKMRGLHSGVAPAGVDGDRAGHTSSHSGALSRVTP
jgi:hypothetical protein